MLICMDDPKVDGFKCPLSEMTRMRLRRLDISNNRISHLPPDIRQMDTLQEVVLDNNPLVNPPAGVGENYLFFVFIIVRDFGF